MEMHGENYTAQAGLDPAFSGISQVLYRCATLSLLWMIKKDINTFAVSLMNIVF
jgi:hypothetical protein